MAQEGPKMAQDGPKMSSGRSQDGCKIAAKSPKHIIKYYVFGSWSFLWPKMAQNVAKMARAGAKMAQEGTKISRDGAEMAQGSAKMAQEGLKMAPRWAPEGAKM